MSNLSPACLTWPMILLSLADSILSDYYYTWRLRAANTQQCIVNVLRNLWIFYDEKQILTQDCLADEPLHFIPRISSKLSV